MSKKSIFSTLVRVVVGATATYLSKAENRARGTAQLNPLGQKASEILDEEKPPKPQVKKKTTKKK